MKKLYVLAGVAIGFVLGSRQGRAPYERLASQARRVAGRPEVEQAVGAVSEKAESVVNLTKAKVQATSPSPTGPHGSIDQAEIDAETKADEALDNEIEDTFPTSDAPSSWAGADIEPERPTAATRQS